MTEKTQEQVNFDELDDEMKEELSHGYDPDERGGKDEQ